VVVPTNHEDQSSQQQHRSSLLSCVQPHVTCSLSAPPVRPHGKGQLVVVLGCSQLLKHFSQSSLQLRKDRPFAIQGKYSLEEDSIWDSFQPMIPLDSLPHSLRHELRLSIHIGGQLLSPVLWDLQSGGCVGVEGFRPLPLECTTRSCLALQWSQVEQRVALLYLNLVRLTHQ
jgi:hypothetical protein